MHLVDASLTRPLARLLAYQGRQDGRIVIIAALILYVAAVAAAGLLWQVNLWPWLGIPPGPSVFFDTRNVLAALECHRIGYDPLVDNPCDPWRRPMFYPRAWLILHWLGLNQSHTNLAGILIGLLFVIALCLLLGRIGMGAGIVFAVAVCSPAVMFALQRGNMDVVLFSVLTTSVMLWRHGGRAGRILSPAVVLLAAFGKLYPIFGLPAFLLLRRRGAALAAAVCGLLFVAYVAATLHDVATVARTATQGQYYSYGARILLGVVYRQFAAGPWEGGSTVAQLVTVILVTALTAGLWIWTRRYLAPAPGAEPRPSATLLSFYLGALIYLGTFLAFKNFDYRLVYLLLTLPQLCAWVRDGRPGDRRTTVAGLGLACVLTALWVGALSEPLRLADELISWIVAGLLGALCAASVPSLAELRQSWRSARPTSVARAEGSP